MSRFFLISFFIALTSCIKAQSRLVDSTVYLVNGNFKVECIKRYLGYKVIVDTFFYNPPRFFNYLFKDRSSKKIKTYRHFEYVTYIDPETGEDWIGEKENVDSTIVNTFFGSIEPESLIKILLGTFSIVDTKQQFDINNNYSIYLSTQNEFLKINTCEPDYLDLIKFEIGELKKGDLVFIDGLSFKSTVHKRCYLGKGYWIIE